MIFKDRNKQPEIRYHSARIFTIFLFFLDIKKEKKSVYKNFSASKTKLSSVFPTKLQRIFREKNKIFRRFYFLHVEEDVRVYY
jgi:hypothetical protein